MQKPKDHHKKTKTKNPFQFGEHCSLSFSGIATSFIGEIINQASIFAVAQSKLKPEPVPRLMQSADCAKALRV
jgi:hypothetical protein|tara:strand:- start:146 stop:364 length:219 start_codon:yes stop_codon:yes gene_type:complete